MIRVANKRQPLPADAGTVVYVGRPSPLGNPFRLAKGAAKGSTLAGYRNWLHTDAHRDPKVGAELRRLRDIAHRGNLTLVCWCAPAPRRPATRTRSAPTSR